MTFGLPQSVCAAIDRLTLHRMTGEVMRMANGFYYEVRNRDMPTIIFLCCFAAIFAVTFFLMGRVQKETAGKYTLGIIIVFSVLFRLILLPGEMIHENDIYRYIWDGKTALGGINPYKFAPADLFMYENGYAHDYYDSYREVTVRAKTFSDSDARSLAILKKHRDKNPVFYKRIGHWQVPTIYPPAVQMLFMVPAALNGDSRLVFKAYFALFDIGSLLLVIGLLKHFGMSPSMSVIYGWSPLVLFEISNAGHYDAIPIFLTLLSLFLYFRRRAWAGTCVLALAALSKFFSGVLLPILARKLSLRHVALFGGIVLMSYAPFVVWGQAGIKGVFAGFMTYNAQWSYNSSVFALIYIIGKKMAGGLTEALLPAKMAAGCLYLTVLAFLSLRKDKTDWEVLRRCFLAVAALFIISPVGDPWYFCWVVPFLCFFPRRSWYLLSGLLMLSYLNFRTDIGITGAKYWGIPWISWIIYVPFYVCLMIESAYKKTGDSSLFSRKEGAVPSFLDNEKQDDQIG